MFAEAVKLFPAHFKDLQLLQGDDEEANFFNNILHIQLHRRIRALHRLTEKCKSGVLNPVCITDLLRAYLFLEQSCELLASVVPALCI